MPKFFVALDLRAFRYYQFGKPWPAGAPVVATAVGGIKEVVVSRTDRPPGCPFAQRSKVPFEALEPEQLARDLAQAIGRLMADEGAARRMAEAGRKTRAHELFSWRAIAERIFALISSWLK